MLHTSIGYHTFTIFKSLTKIEFGALLKHFKDYSKKNKQSIKIFTTDNRKKNYVIRYYNENVGFCWEMRCLDYYQEFKAYTVEATINPRIMIDSDDYITAASEDCLDIIQSKFNNEARKISTLLGELSSYNFNRIDYCINFDLEELGIDISPSEFMKLIKRSNIPNNFTEWTKRDPLSHRNKTDPNTFYLKSNSVVINCYGKHHQLMNTFPECPSLEGAKNIIRFEVQCKYKKIYSMSRKYRNASEEGGIMLSLLDDSVSCEIIKKYYAKTIGYGDYYTLKKAKKIIKQYNFKPDKEKSLIETLELINKCRSVVKARENIPGDKNKKNFNRRLKELSGIGINPVTIPKSIDRGNIQNLLELYLCL